MERIGLQRARDDLGKLIIKVSEHGACYLLTKNGVAKAKLVPLLKEELEEENES